MNNAKPAPLNNQRDSNFVRCLMIYGGSDYMQISEQQRIGFCNWLLVECLSECPYQDEFIKHFSAGGDPFERRRIANMIERDGFITMNDIVDAVFHSTRNPDGLVNYAGEDGVR